VTLGDVLLFANGRWLPALLYLFLSIGGGVVAVLVADVLGQWCVKLIKNRLKPQTVVATKEDHLDVQDDLLLPD